MAAYVPPKASPQRLTQVLQVTPVSEWPGIFERILTSVPRQQQLAAKVCRNTCSPWHGTPARRHLYLFRAART